MFTSCFKISGKDPRAVAICNGTRGYPGVKAYKSLAPDFADVKAAKEGSMDRATFDGRYLLKLEKLDPRKAYEDLVKLAGNDAILLCWEMPGQWCHRFATARWLEKGNGILIPEYYEAMNPKAKGSDQMVLMETPRRQRYD